MATKSSDSQIKRVYAYYGADDARKRAAVEKLVSELVAPEFRDFDFETLYGPDVTTDRLMTGCQVVPFGSERRVVLVTQANDIPAAEQLVIAERLERIPESACLLLVTPAPQMKDGKPKAGSELSKELMAAVRKAGKAESFPLMKDHEAAALVRELVTREGKEISRTAAAAVVRRCGSDSGVITSEVAKIVSYAGDRTEITNADVEEVTVQTVEEKIFAMMDAVGSKNPALALAHLKPLLQGGDSEVQGEALRTLSMLARHFRQIWQVRVLLDAGCRVIAPGNVPEHLEGMLPADNVLKVQDWQLARFVTQARNFTLEELVHCFERIAEADLAIKGIYAGVSDAALALETLVVELSSRKESGRGRLKEPSPDSRT